mgnify:CR=1 FL=1
MSRLVDFSVPARQADPLATPGGMRAGGPTRPKCWKCGKHIKWASKRYCEWCNRRPPEMPADLAEQDAIDATLHWHDQETDPQP